MRGLFPVRVEDWGRRVGLPISRRYRGMTALLVALLCFVISMEYSCQIVPGPVGAERLLRQARQCSAIQNLLKRTPVLPWRDQLSLNNSTPLLSTPDIPSSVYFGDAPSNIKHSTNSTPAALLLSTVNPPFPNIASTTYRRDGRPLAGVRPLPRPGSPDVCRHSGVSA